jgi:uncharacterized repeat protein (TIGR02543 family)
MHGSVETIGIHAFYDCAEITIYTDAASINPEWHKHWNSKYRPIVWGCTLSEDKSYVVSVKVAEKTFQFINAKGGITAPERAGYTFDGWATEENGEVVYTEDAIVNAPVGTTLYAIWTAETN